MQVGECWSEFVAEGEGEIDLKVGDIVTIKSIEDDWCLGTTKLGKTG